ncbi:MAG TPA: YceI family protein [Gemmatimonadales bacterium]|nr:YceI family protein [Gemmatimonadales bacterium]
MRFVLSAVALLLSSPISAQTSAAAAPDSWKIDPNHSTLAFKIRHLVSTVSGTFLEWGGTLRADPANLAAGSVDVTIQTASITTRHDRRDTDLRSANFFDAENNPTISFKSTSVEVHGEILRITGDLTMHGVTRPVTLEGQYAGAMGAGAQQRIGFSASGKLNRLDWGIAWNRAVEGGGVLLGDEVTLEIAISAVRAAS